eukprot:1493418-Pyramimonas_sp.AAC.1
MAYQKIASLNLRQVGDTLDSTAKIDNRLRESGWLTFIDDKDPPALENRSQDETTVVEIDDLELGDELNG